MLYAFFWVILRRLNFTCRRFGTLCLFHLHRRVGILSYPPKRRHIKFRRRGIAQKKAYNKVFCVQYFFFFVDDVEEYGRSIQATDGNLIRRRKDVICLLVILRKERRYTVIIFHIYCFSTAIVVARTRPGVNVVHTLPVLLFNLIV